MKLTRKFRKEIHDMLIQHSRISVVDPDDVKNMAAKVMQLDLDEEPLTAEYVIHELTNSCWKLITSSPHGQYTIYHLCMSGDHIEIAEKHGLVVSTRFCDETLMGGRLKELDKKVDHE